MSLHFEKEKGDSWLAILRARLAQKRFVGPSYKGLSVLRWGDVGSFIPFNGQISVVAASPIHQSIIAAGMDGGRVSVFENNSLPDKDVERGMMGFQVRSAAANSNAHKGTVTSLCFLEEHVLVSSGLDGTVKLWDCTHLQRSSEVLELAFQEAVTVLSVPRTHGSGAVIVAGTIGGSITVKDLRSHSGTSDVSVTRLNSTHVTVLETSTDYKVYSGDLHGNIELRDLRFLKPNPLISFLSTTETSVHPAIPYRDSLSKLKQVKRNEPIITDDMWDIALGGGMTGKKKRPRKPDSDRTFSEMVELPSHFSDRETKAHQSRVICLGSLTSQSIVSVSNDQNIKVFCTVSGKQIHSTSIVEKPICASYNNGMLCLGARGRFVVLDTTPDRGVTKIISNNAAHMGSITANCFVGDWGICTAGSDRHVFVHKLDDSS